MLEVISAFEAIKTFGSDIVNSAKRKKSIKTDCFAIQPNIKKRVLAYKINIYSAIFLIPYIII